MYVDVDDGSTVTDYLKAERERGITITSACIPLAWKGARINLIDTPGHIDFTMEVERAVRVLDGAVCLLDAVAGVEAQTENVWKQANRHSIPRIIFINKMDREGSSLSKTISAIESRLCGWGAPLVIQWPVVSGHSDAEIRSGAGGPALSAILDLPSMQILRWDTDPTGSVITKSPILKSDTHYEEAKRQRILLVEALSELDDTIVDTFLSHDADHMQVPEKEIHQALRRVSLSGKGVPVFCGAAFRNMGVQPVLDAIVDFLPSPVERPDIYGVDQRKNQVPISVEDPQLCAMAFKVINDEKRGPLVFVRVYSGMYF